MVYRIAGGIGLVLIGLMLIGVSGIPYLTLLTGAALLVGGIALLAGL